MNDNIVFVTWSRRLGRWDEVGTMKRSTIPTETGDVSSTVS